MKKESVFSLIVLLCSSVACMMTLRFYYNMQCSSIFQELIIAIFTGCIFAIPSVAFSLIKGNIKTNSDVYITLFNIKKNIDKMKTISNVNIADLKNKIDIICELHKKLELLLSENYVKNYKTINDISEDTLLLLTEMRIVFNSLNQNPQYEKSWMFGDNCKEIDKLKKAITENLDKLPDFIKSD